MKLLISIISLLLSLADFAVAIDPITPGKYVLIFNEKNLDPLYTPITVEIDSKGGLKSVGSVNGAPISATLDSEGESYIFSFQRPGRSEIPPKGQDWPKTALMTFAGGPSSLVQGALDGVFTSVVVYHHSDTSNRAATGSFLLYPINAPGEK